MITRSNGIENCLFPFTCYGIRRRTYIGSVIPSEASTTTSVHVIMNVGILCKAAFLLTLLLSVSEISAGKKNVLFLVADDMRPQLGAYYGPDFPAPVHPKMHSPNLDSLASRSLLLRRSYCQQAICSPSRTSLLTGRRPDTTHVYDLKTYWRKSGGNFTTLPQYFKENGYHTVGMGKIFHPGPKASGKDDPISWSEPYWHAPAERGFWQGFGRNHSWFAVNDSMKAKYGDLPDEQIAHHAIKTLNRLAGKVQTPQHPFFLAVGFRRPHLPFVVPERFYHLYPDVRLPDNPYAPVNMPSMAWSEYNELRKYGDIHVLNASGAINTTLPNKVVLELRRGYYSAVSYTDHLIGTVLEELDRLGLTNDTIVSFWGDHGWHLGENGEWTKHTNFELGTHAPMMIRMPGVTDHGIQTEALTEFVDLFPSLSELAGLPRVPLCPPDSSHVRLCTEGVSVAPLLKNPTRKWKEYVFSQYPRNHSKFMGYTLRSDQYRYTEWARFQQAPVYAPDWNELYGMELYDHKLDPEENHNQAYNPNMKNLQEELRKILRKGWRNALPVARPNFSFSAADKIEFHPDVL